MPCGASRAVIFQYSSGLNASISRSRSTISRTATDCTRPALRAARHLLAEQVAERVADDAVEDAAGFLGLDPVHVDLARVGERLLHGRSRDLVERDAERAVVVELQLVLDVPGDRLALAVGVGRQVDAAGLGGFALQLGEDVLARLARSGRPCSSSSILDDVGRHPAASMLMPAMSSPFLRRRGRSRTWP